MQAECQSLGMGQNFGPTFFHADKWPIGQRQTKSSQLWWFLPILTLRPGSHKQLLEQEEDHHSMPGRRLTQNSSEGGSSQHFHLFLGGLEWAADKRIPKSLVRVRMWEIALLWEQNCSLSWCQYGDMEQVKFLVFHFDLSDDDSNRNHKQEVSQKYSYWTEYFSNLGDRNQHHLTDLLSICLRTSPHLPRTYTWSLLQTWAFQEKRGVMQWHSTPDRIGNKTLMHLRMCHSTNVQWGESSSTRTLLFLVFLGSYGLSITGRSFRPSLETSTAGRVWKIFSTPWSWLVKLVPRCCSWSSTSHYHGKLVGPGTGGSALKLPRRTVDIWNTKAPSSTSIWCLKVTHLGTGLMLGSVSGDCNAAKSKKVHNILFHGSDNFLVLFHM